MTDMFEESGSIRCLTRRMMLFGNCVEVNEMGIHDL